MSGEKNLKQLLAHMAPELKDEEYVFCSVEGSYGSFSELNPLASFRESEGLTVVVTKASAESAQLKFEETFRVITLNVHSSLEAVGLTAAVSTQLAGRGISANVMAAYYHDHIFVPAHRADAALGALKELQKA